MKKLITIVCTLIALFTLLIVIAYYKQNNILDEHGVEFNDERKRLGIFPLGDFEAIYKVNWDINYEDYTYEKWKSILTNRTIVNYVQYTFPEKKKKVFHKRKDVFYMTRLLFWQNHYSGEADVFNYQLDSNRTIELSIIYESANDTQVAQFYSYIDTNYSYENPNYFGGGCEDVELPQRVDKDEADKILKEWGLLE